MSRTSFFFVIVDQISCGVGGEKRAQTHGDAYDCFLENHEL